jgi:SAM-dependent methyltransferase
MAVNENVYKNWAGYHTGLALKDQEYFSGLIKLAGKVAKPGDLLLDVGCGSGISVEALRGVGYNAIGCDVFVGAHVVKPFVVGSGLHLPMADETFQIVTADSYLEHVFDVETALSELNRVCKPNGYIVIHCPNLLSPIHPLKALLYYRRQYIKSKLAFCTPFGNTTGKVLGQMMTNLCLLLGKMMDKEVKFTVRTPDFEHPEYGDMDAFWWSNPIEIKRWFILRGHDIVDYQSEGKSSFLKEFSSAVQIIIRKKRNFPHNLGTTPAETTIKTHI